MALSQNKYLFIDCQTTGMRPSSGQVLELAWSYGLADGTAPLHSHLVRLPEGEEIPPRVREITGIEDLSEARTLEEVFALFRETLLLTEPPVTAIIHYAQFERPFLLDMFQRLAGAGELPFDIVCSHQLAKRLFPNLPSQNIRGAAGFFGASIGSIKRAASHVRATEQIWRGLSLELEKRGIGDLTTLETWLRDSPKAKATRYEYHLDKLKRLELPDSPGVYRMISKTGEILYVGKATSLKNRVNSYFRGKKGRDKFKLEMLAQVWDLRVTDCATPLEAALLESDEIKRHNPPYNVVLKRGRRHLVFYNREFNSVSLQQSRTHRFGPFRNSNWIERLRAIARSLKGHEFEQIFFEPVPQENLRQGFALFCQLQKISLLELGGERSLLAVGLWLVKDYVEEEVLDEEIADESEEREYTIEELAGKFERLLRRAGVEYLRTTKLTRLLNSEITLGLESGPRRLRFRGGLLSDDSSPLVRDLPWKDLTIDDYDRMSILCSELAKYNQVTIAFSS